MCCIWRSRNPIANNPSRCAKEEKNWKIVLFGRKLFAWKLSLTLAYEGIVVVEKVGSLENSVQLKLAVVCWLTCHHHWKKRSYYFPKIYFKIFSLLVVYLALDSRNISFFVLWKTCAMISDQLQIYLRRRHLMSKYGLSWVGSFKVTSCTCQLTTWTRQKEDISWGPPKPNIFIYVRNLTSVSIYTEYILL